MPRQKMSKWDRIMAARSGEAVDRVPVSLWHHWPGVDVSADTLAEGRWPCRSASTSTS